MKIILAPDSFKGSLTAVHAAEAMAAGIKKIDPSICTLLLPLADGGEGTMENMVQATNGVIMRHTVQNPIGNPIKAGYGVLGDGKTCVIEFAEASGLMLIPEQDRNPLLTSSYGTGELIRHALDAGYRKFVIGLGGSATNDGGAGLLQALGMKLLDENGDSLPFGGGALGTLSTFDLSGFDTRIKDSYFTIANDVDNPFVGPNGASAIFGPQKGATPEMVDTLDANLCHFANLIEQTAGVSLHTLKGAGAAGGAGGAFTAFFPGELRTGIDVVLEAVSFKEVSASADLVITGEGKSDIQTLSGKAPVGISRALSHTGIPVILISGCVDEISIPLLAPFFADIHSLVEDGISSERAMTEATMLLQNKTKQVVDMYLSHIK